MPDARQAGLVADHQLPAERDLLRQREQAPVVAGRYEGFRLHLDCHRVTDHEIDLELRPAAPVGEGIVPAAIVQRVQPGHARTNPALGRAFQQCYC